jgi:hypothetical protein
MKKKRFLKRHPQPQPQSLPPYLPASDATVKDETVEEDIMKEEPVEDDTVEEDASAPPSAKSVTESSTQRATSSTSLLSIDTPVLSTAAITAQASGMVEKATKSSLPQEAVSIPSIKVHEPSSEEGIKDSDIKSASSTPAATGMPATPVFKPNKQSEHESDVALEDHQSSVFNDLGSDESSDSTSGLQLPDMLTQAESLFETEESKPILKLPEASNNVRIGTLPAIQAEPAVDFTETQVDEAVIRQSQAESLFFDFDDNTKPIIRPPRASHNARSGTLSTKLAEASVDSTKTQDGKTPAFNKLQNLLQDTRYAPQRVIPAVSKVNNSVGMEPTPTGWRSEPENSTGARLDPAECDEIVWDRESDSGVQGDKSTVQSRRLLRMLTRKLLERLLSVTRTMSLKRMHLMSQHRK